MGKGGDSGLKLVIDRKRKPARAYPGEPIACTCGNRHLIETFMPRRKEGRETKGKL